MFSVYVYRHLYPNGKNKTFVETLVFIRSYKIEDTIHIDEKGYHFPITSI